jgi:hypothetical protein
MHESSDNGETTRVIDASQARQVLTDGDIQSDIAFQNDINHLLALVDELWGGRTKPARR